MVSSVVPRTKIIVASNAVSERDAIAFALRQHGFRTLSVSTFELPFATALEQPDLVLIDVDRLGVEEVRRLVDEGAGDLRVIIFAARPLSELRDFAFSCGAAWYFRKPPAAGDVVETVESFLGRREPELRSERADFVARARTFTRSQFVAAWAFPFLVGSPATVTRSKRPRTAAILDPDVVREAVCASWHPPAVLAVPIRKVTDTHPDRITIGRSPDSDIVIDHATLSNAHAYFLVTDAGLQLADAGSRNGTWAVGRLVEPNGPPSAILESGDLVRFGELEYKFLSATAAWDTLRVRVG